MSRFSHISSDFPGTPETPKYNNEFDYSRWEVSSGCTVKLLNVAWGSDFQNVVKWDDDEARNSWFDSAKGEVISFDSAFHIVGKQSIKLPIPYESAIRFNYIMVEYKPQTSSAEPIEYLNKPKTRWFYFIDSVNQHSPNTTSFELLLDTWTTYINDIEIDYMMLERGHAPVKAVTVEKYLEKPIDNCTYLTAPDVNYSGSIIEKSIHNFTFNDSEMLAVINTNANPKGTWGTKAANTWKVPALSAHTSLGVPAPINICCKADDLNTLLTNLENDYPQFIQTINAVWFVSNKLVTLGDSFTFAGTSCYYIEGIGQKDFDLLELKKSNFGYDYRWSDLAKLYTYPYAYIEIVDSNGGKAEIRIEDTTGTLKVHSILNTAFPSLNINAYISGVGGRESRNITFANVSERSFRMSGRWYDFLVRFDIPTFAVIQGNDRTNDYTTHYSRKQERYSTDRHITAANSNLTEQNSYIDDMQTYTLTKMGEVWVDTSTQPSGDAGYDSQYYRNISGLELEGIACAQVASTVGSVIGGATTAASTGNAPSGIAQALTGVVSASYNATCAIANNVGAYEYNRQLTAGKLETAKTYNRSSNTRGKLKNTRTNTIHNNLSDDITTNSINNQKAGAAISAPNTFGSYSNTDTAATMPMGFTAHVVTQNKGAIRQTADTFKRYGYMLNQQWEFDDFNVMEHFTYWKAAELWLSGATNAIDGAREHIKSILENGVTVWRGAFADRIGMFSIYDN